MFRQTNIFKKWGLLRKDTEYTPQMHYFECMLDIEEGHINQGRSCKN